MATIDPITRMNPAATRFYELATQQLERVGDENFNVVARAKGRPVLVYDGVDLALPEGKGIHAQREAAVEILHHTTGLSNWHALREMYNAGYYCGQQDEAVYGRCD